MSGLNNNVFIFDIPGCSIGQEIIITGIITDKKPFRNKIVGIVVRDITGKVWCILDLEKINNDLLQCLHINVRIKISGTVELNSKGNRVLTNIKNIDILGAVDSEFSELDSEMRDQAARMLMSRICKKVSSFLQNNQFIEFESRLISNRWYEDSLEFLQVIYPGFGSPAYLVTSPAAQIIDFMTKTIIPKAYTITTSFTYSFRFTNGSAETKVIVAKAMNLSSEEHEQLMLELSLKILGEFNRTQISSKKYLGEWSKKIDGEEYSNKQLDSDLNLIKFATNIPVIGKNWNSNIDSIIQILDKDKNILVEGSQERLANDLTISSLTIYPSQFLGLIEKAPLRQLSNLTKLFDGKR